MKPLMLSLSMVLLAVGITSFHLACSPAADDVTGAWQLKNGNEEQVVVFIDGYFTHTTYNQSGKKFIQTRGGAYSLANNKLTITYEFDTGHKDQVGQSVSYGASVNNNRLGVTLNGVKETWERIDEGKAPLAGLWKITARKQEGQLVAIHQSGTRKTIKILTGTRFQWAAIDPGSKQFMGTGGGVYTFADGKYTEHIQFFSRDSSRVGSSLSFDGKLENGNWHHSGLSSKGDPIYEVWSRKTNTF